MHNADKKTKRYHKVKTSSGVEHKFTARNVSINKLAAHKLNVKRLAADLQKEQSIIEASDIPIN